MVYITVPQSPMYRQMSLDEFLFGGEARSSLITNNLTNTRTYETEEVSEAFLKAVNAETLIAKLQQFNITTEELRQKPRESLYSTFHIPKKSGGLRRIDAPNPELMDALRGLKRIFEEDFNALYHTSAFAYMKNRSTLDAVKRHQSNESRWFAKFDLSNFFGSTTLDFTLKMLSMVFPFSEVMRYAIGEEQLRTALELAFLNGGLPQGTPVSPMLTNIIMIPIDYKLSNTLRDFNKQSYVYTRYADDFLVSSKHSFRFKDIEAFITKTLRAFDAPFSIKPEKTRYGSSNGSNWNLGIMLNKDNELTIGHKKKRQFQAMLSSFVLDSRNGTQWSLDDVQRLEGYRNYYRMIEGETIDRIVSHVGAKYNADIVDMIKEQLRA